MLLIDKSRKIYNDIENVELEIHKYNYDLKFKYFPQEILHYCKITNGS